MRKIKAFTLIELLVVISIIALLIGILLPALGAARRTARQMQNSTQVRGIHTALVLFAQGNGTYYPARTGVGGDTAATSDLQSTGNAYDTSSKFRELLEDNYFTGEYAISPSETKTPWTQLDVATANYSYAGLGWAASADVGQNRNEWRETTNTEAVVLSDRGIANGTGYRSVHTNPNANQTEWRGSVGWNDNHVSFEADATVDTGHGSTNVTDDNLFSDSGGSGTGTAVANNASMVYGQTAGTSTDVVGSL